MKPILLMKPYHLISIAFLFILTACQPKEIPPEDLSDGLNGPACMAAYTFGEVGSLQPLYLEDCPSCQYVFSATNGARIVEEITDHSVTIRAGAQDFQVNAKITYDGGETNTVSWNVAVDGKDAIGKLNELEPDLQLNVLGGFEHNGNGYVLASTMTDYRIYKYHPDSDKWQGMEVAQGAFNGARITRPQPIGSDEFYFTSMMNEFFKYDSSAHEFTALGNIPCPAAAINYSYNDKYYSGAGSGCDSIYEYDPTTATWTASYQIDPGLFGGVSRACYPFGNKAYVFLNTGGTMVLDFATQTFTPMTGVGYQYQESVIFELYGNLHIITNSTHTIINTTTNVVTPYNAFTGTVCGTTLTNFSPTAYQYSFFSIADKGIAVDTDGEVYHFTPNY